MTRRARLTSRIFGGMGLVTLIAMFTVRVNITPSVPYGIYWIAHEHPSRGDAALICAPDDIIAQEIANGRIPTFVIGPCYDHTWYLVKYVAAVAGDVVDVSGKGIAVNGVHQSNTECSGSVAFADGQHVVPRGKVLVLGTNPLSTDGRDWGFMPSSVLKSKLIPLITWGDSKC